MKLYYKEITICKTGKRILAYFGEEQLYGTKCYF